MIWYKNYTMQEIESFMSKRNMVKLLDIQITEIGPDYLKATMPVDERTHQVYGILHGGATCVLVESAGSLASGLCIDLEKQYSVGSQINVNHLRPVKSGLVIATCRNIHLGRQKHVWDVMVHAQETGKLIAKGELTCAVVDQEFNLSSAT